MEICNADAARFASWQIVMAKRALDMLKAHGGSVPEEGMRFPEIFN